MGKGGVAGTPAGQSVDLWMGTAALSERDYVHEAIDRADLILAIGHDTVEKPPFLMGPAAPRSFMWDTPRATWRRSISRTRRSSATSVPVC